MVRIYRNSAFRQNILFIAEILLPLQKNKHLIMNVENAVIDFARNRIFFEKDELIEHLSRKLSISPKTLLWYLYHLVGQQKITRIGRGKYSIAIKPRFSPLPSTKVIRLYNKLKKQFPLLSFCMYNGEILSNLQHHLSYNNNIYIETDRDALEAVFHYLKDSEERTYITPSADFMADYVHLDRKAIIVKPLISEAPVQEINGVPMPELEKLLVDIQCDKDFFYLQGQESIYMMDNAFSQYSVNMSRLLRYAGRRNVKSVLETYLNSGNYD